MDDFNKSPISKSPDRAPTSPLYFPVCLWKLALMSICTFGFYEVYCFYKYWDFIKKRNRPRINRVLRSIFFPYIFNFSLFRDIYRSSSGIHNRTGIEPIFLSVSWIIISFAGFLPKPYYLFGFLGFLPLLQAQATINKMNMKINEGFDRNCRLSAWNIVAIVIGGLLLLLSILGTFLPPPPPN